MSVAAYPAYKDSGVEWLGTVPEGWLVKPLWAMTTCNDEVLSDSTAPDYIIEYVEISDVDAVAGILSRAELEFSAAPSRARRCVRDGDVIVSTVRTYLRAIAAIQNPSANTVVSTGFAVMRPRSIHAGYLAHLFRSEFLINQIISRSVGVSYPAINASEISHFRIPVPSSSEQSAIAAFLDRETAKIDALVAEQERLMALLKEKRQAVISQAVTKGLDPNAPMKASGVAWLGDVPAHWEVMRVKHVTRALEQGWSPQCEGFPVESPDVWGVLKVGCVNGGRFNADENKTLPDSLEPVPDLGLAAGDVLISRANTRELVGSAAMVPEDHPRLMLCDKLYRVRLDRERCQPQFLAFYLGSGIARGRIELAAGGASSSMLNISQDAILDLVIALPPASEQIGALDFIDRETTRLDSLTTEATRAIALLRERRAALISAAVTGKIDVRHLAPATQAAA